MVVWQDCISRLSGSCSCHEPNREYAQTSCTIEMNPRIQWRKRRQLPPPHHMTPLTFAQYPLGGTGTPLDPKTWLTSWKEPHTTTTKLRIRILPYLGTMELPIINGDMVNLGAMLNPPTPWGFCICTSLPQYFDVKWGAVWRSWGKRMQLFWNWCQIPYDQIMTNNGRIWALLAETCLEGPSPEPSVMQ